jgi:hypothetical protein
VKPKLDQLVPHAERAKIEAALAKKVPPPPTAAEVEAHDLAHQRKMQEDHGIGPESPGRAASGCQPAGPEVTSTCMLADHTQTPTGLQRHLGKEVLKRQR